MSFSREETICELNKFWETEIKYWEHELGVTSDESKEPYIKSLEEMGNMELEYSPLYPFPEEKYRLDVEGVKAFFRYRKIDIYMEKIGKQKQPVDVIGNKGEKI